MCIRDRSMDKLKALAKIYGVSLDWLCSDSDMADEKPIEAVSYTHLDVYKRQYKATSQNKEIQYQSINQSFRMVGSINEKHGNQTVSYTHLDVYKRQAIRLWRFGPANR